ncbi:hypothetical protein D3227_05180 [Mesorhizobium waimense]|uniref:Uncharacterized protein n=1 Tax=Mesorhizobium waimense TaxID=1300307 RepID=A0A3A5L976_9HYPH|nr:hypothetical protein [Mesorhizobium waimense]RJT42064.1 hypothetical protein D3227_05180 [Mesorhizobium waimense]
MTLKFMPTFDFKACRINAVDVTAEADGLATISIKYSTVRDPDIEWVAEFVDGPGFTSWRFQRLLNAVGVVGHITDGAQLVGRHFAVKSNGAIPDDFATLEYASACLQCDRQRFLDGALLEPRVRQIRATGEDPSPKGFQRIATFDLELGPAVTMHDLRLVKTPSGGLHAYPPDSKHGTKCADFAPTFRDQIADLAAKALESQLAHNSSSQPAS